MWICYVKVQKVYLLQQSQILGESHLVPVQALATYENCKVRTTEPGMQCHMRDIGPYTRVGRVADHENCAWASHIFERSSSTWMEDMMPTPSSECSRILEGLKSPCLINWSSGPIQNQRLLTASLSWRHANICHMTLHPRPPLFSRVRWNNLGAWGQGYYGCCSLSAVHS